MYVLFVEVFCKIIFKELSSNNNFQTVVVMVIITQIQLSRSFFSHILITIIIDVIFHHYPHFDLLRHCQRFLPISGSCHANKEEMKKLAEQLFQSLFFAEDVKPSTVCRKRRGT